MIAFLLMPAAELMALPTSGPAWTAMLARANASWETPNLQDHNVKHGLGVLAAALVFARTGDKAAKAKAKAGLFAAIATLPKGTTSFSNSGLGPLRQVTAYVLAADLLALAPAARAKFADWLAWFLDAPAVGDHGSWGGVRKCSEKSNNNWWGWGIAARVAGDRFLGRTADLATCWAIFQGFMGDRTKYTGFNGQVNAISAAGATWACSASQSVYAPVNGACSRSGINLDGIVPEDAMRGGPLSWPPGEAGVSYTTEILCGAALTAELLHRAGYPAYEAVNQALRRMADVLTRAGEWNYSSVNYHLPWLLNRRYGLSLPTRPAGYGRTFGWTDWLYGSAATA